MTVGLLSFAAAAAIGTTWSQLRIGAGGFITGLDIAPDGTTVVRCDTFNAYKWNGTSWAALLSKSSMPSGAFGHAANGDWIGTQGVYEIVIAPSNSSRFWMLFNGLVFRTDNGGSTWSATSFTQVANCDPNDQGNPGRITSQRMAVDPNDPDVCFAGTASNGLWVTRNGGATWTQISTASVPLGTTNSGGVIICFDSTSSVVGGKTQVLYASSYGNGVYRSADGGTTWSLLSGSPATHAKMICRNGVLYHIDNSNSAKGELRTYTGSWSSALPVDGGSPSNVAGVDVDPANSSRVVCIDDGGRLSVSTSGGASFTGWVAGTRSTGSGEPQWLSWTNESYMSAGNIRFHPIHANELWFAEGISPWVSNPPNTVTANAWAAKAQGIEQLVSNGVISPPGGVPLVYGWDRPIFRVADPTQYAATHGPNNTNPIIRGCSADWGSSVPSFIVLLGNAGGSTDETSKSVDGGLTWSALVLPGSGAWQGFGGMIAAASDQNFVFIPAQDAISIFYTTNGGAGWNTGSISGPIAGSGNGFSHNAAIDRQVLCADRVNANTFYVYYNGTANSDGAGTNADGAIAGIYKSTDGGATWTKVHSGRFGNSGSANTDYGMSFFGAKLRSVPNLGSTSTAGHLFFTCSDVSGSVVGPLYRSTDGGATWSQIANVLEAEDVGFGAPAPGQSYPAVYIAGWVGGTAESNYGIWRSIDNCVTWVKLTDYPYGNFDFPKCISGDSNTYGDVYVGFQGSGWAFGR